MALYCTRNIPHSQPLVSRYSSTGKIQPATYNCVMTQELHEPILGSAGPLRPSSTTRPHGSAVACSAVSLESGSLGFCRRASTGCPNQLLFLDDCAPTWLPPFFYGTPTCHHMETTRNQIKHGVSTRATISRYGDG